MKLYRCVCGECKRSVYVVDDWPAHEVKIIIDNPELKSNESILVDKVIAIDLIKDLCKAFKLSVLIGED